MRYQIRAATREDEDQLLVLAEHLDSVNLPHDRAAIREILESSEDSFSGARADPRDRQFVFVLRDSQQDRAVGTSMIIAQLGTRDAPYIFFDVRNEERYSETLDRHFVHRLLTIGYSYHGPTEIGGLVVHPDCRRAPESLGMLISYVRFLFIALHRDWFQARVLAELMPPLEPDGTSHLWEAVGRHFTGMSYREADRLSKSNKEFIRGLFPTGDIYTSLLSPDAQSVIGEVGADTKGVARMLTRIGFRYWDRVDPFDGGPHYIAPTDEIELVQRTSRRTPISGVVPENGAKRVLLARDFGHQAPYFVATPVLAHLDPETPDSIQVEDSTLAYLENHGSGITAVLPLR